MLLAPLAPATTPALDDAAAAGPDAPDKAELVERLEAVRARLDSWQQALFAEQRRAVLVVLQGRDASGKDGTVRGVFGGLNPQGLSTTSFKAPNLLERSHDYLWRVHQAVPPCGMIGLFNRSHYEDVLVARVHALVPPDVWRKRYAQINDFERMLTENGVVILKFFLHISGEEQRKRLEARLKDPSKSWKFDVDDIGERARWEEYRAAYAEALERCSTPHAPWYVVPSDRKPVRNLLVAETVLRCLEGMHPEYPPTDPAVAALRGTLK